MDQVTGIEVQSYGTDTGLLDALRESWPVEGASSVVGDGFRPIDLAGLEVIGAVLLTDRLGVALLAERDGSFASVPIAREEYGGPWRRAQPGDGLSAFVAGVPEASERPIGVDQTHESVVVGERAILKWFGRVGPGPSRATKLLAHLAEVGFDGIPAPLGSLAWKSPSGAALTLAQGDVYLPGARDGWEWCVERAAAGDASVGRTVGALVARLQAALATQSSIINYPTMVLGPEDVDAWIRDALVTLEEALALTTDPELDTWAPAMRQTIRAAQTGRSITTQSLHGDLHVGQVLQWPGGLAIIDFDGDPTLPDPSIAVRGAREQDVAHMTASLDHVGRVVEERDGGDRSAWIRDARTAFLEAVSPINDALLAAFEVEQECRELVYAARFLPRWRYAPMATLRARFG